LPVKGFSVKTDVISLLTDLVSIDSSNPGVGERNVAEYLASVCRDLGFETRILEAAPGRSNLLVSADAGSGSGVLGLSGHLDTKPVGDAENAWRTPPLDLTVQEGRAYGLGTSDMKGGIAAMVAATERWAARATEGRIELIFTADEEAGGALGARWLADQSLISADAIVIGEPSGVVDAWEAIYTVSRGMCCFDIVVEGVQGHSGLSDQLPMSATVAAAKVVSALHELNPSFSDAPDDAWKPTVNSAVLLEGGVFYGVHPGHARIGCDIRLVPGMSPHRLESEIRSCVESSLPEEIGWRLEYPIPALRWVDPVAVPNDHPVLSAASAAATKVLERDLHFRAYPGGTDATSFFLGAGIPSVASLGPGWLSVAHGPNECVDLGDVVLAVDLYAELIAQYFG
jgi:succinyl-diaminopimelate desuccinylase